MNATAQVEYESRVRLRYGAIAFAAALLLVGSQLLQLAGPHASVQELTLDLIVANKRSTLDLLGAVCDTLGLLCVGVLLNWLFEVTRARNPGMRQIVRWLATVGAGVAAVMALTYTIIVATKAHDFVTSGTQGYPQASALTSSSGLAVLQLLLQLGILLLTLGCIWTSLNAMRVGLLTRMVGYVGVVAGALFLFPIGALVPVIQGYWLAAVAVTLAARWPSGDPPAWAAGVAVAPAPVGNAGQRQQATRGTRAQRRRVSTQEVLAAVEPQNENGAPRTDAPSPSTSAGKRKRKRK